MANARRDAASNLPSRGSLIALLATAATAAGRITCYPSPCPNHGLPTVEAPGGHEGTVRNDQLPAMQLFLRDAGSGKARRVVIVDVGANNGAWSRSMAPLCAKHRGGPCELVWFEPQPQFGQTLTELEQTLQRAGHKARFEPAAAWREQANLTFYLSKNSEAASVSSQLAAKAGRKPEPTVVRALDLARYMREKLALPRSDEDVITLVKIDVESSEYELLPHLLAERALCGVRYLHIEFHLDALTADRRLAALSNMLAFEHNLNATCLRSAGYTPPRLIVREESPKVNGLKVDGLREVLEQHWAASVRELNHFYNKGKAKARRPHGQTERFLKNATRTGSNRGRSLRGHRRHADRDSSWGAWFAG